MGIKDYMEEKQNLSSKKEGTEEGAVFPETDQGMLCLCATPIGNLGDITLRVLETLKTVDLIAAEDTRHTIHLLNHFGIKTPMTSYHEYNKYEKADVLVKKMLEGAKVALVTDAGTPGISDPGEELVKRCRSAGVRVTSLPGPAACVTALTMSGLSTRRFAFEAFLPADKKERKQVLEELKRETRTIILYEAPHHLKNTAEELFGALGDRNITVCRELTKIHESAETWQLSGFLKFLEEHEPRGEYVLVVEGKSARELREEEIQKWEELSVEEHMAYYEGEGYTEKEAMKLVARDRGVSKREIYQKLKA